ncbi:MAG: sulfotransferase [Pseudomonadales bacterium]|nr:sulfotransferase [Pseudomonadales bacterium]MBO7004633.1 sulfotransferase [Pseudomonadales bacterium]
MKSKRAPNLDKAIEYLQAKNGVKVVETCRKLLKKDPKNFDLLHLMGIGYRLQKKFDRALEYFHKAEKVRPEGTAPLYCNMAAAVLKQRKESIFRADKYVEKARKLAPDLIETHEVSADVFSRTGDPFSAEEAFKKGLELRPNEPRLLRKLAKALKEGERFDASLEAIERARSVAPMDYSIMEEYADIREQRGETEEALDAFTALRDDPRSNSYLVDQRIVGMLSTHGQKEEVERRALELTERFPNSLGPHLTLIRLGKYPGGVDKGIETIDELGKNSKRRIVDNFAIADGYDKEKNYDLAFEHLLAGNAAKRERERKRYPGIETTHEHHNNIKSVFEGNVHELMSGSEDADKYPTPIFVLGMPRSGTSLTEQLLGMHSQIYPAGELTFLPQLIKFGHGAYLNHPKQRESAHFIRARDTYLKCIKEISNDSPFVIDKMPHNHENLGFIRKLFPNAIIIHTFRDPISNCLSLFKANFGGWHPYAQDLNLLGLYYREYQKLMDFWGERFGDTIYQSRYENLVDDMRTVVTEILSIAGLEWEDEIEGFHSVDRIVRTASNDQVRQPIYKSSKKSWTKYGDSLQPLIDSLMRAGAITEADLA